MGLNLMKKLLVSLEKFATIMQDTGRNRNNLHEKESPLVVGENPQTFYVYPAHRKI